MALDTNFNVNPYYDDFDEDKKFLRMLFKPGYAVQARELTQLQTILQKQVERFGNHVFKNGSVVTGGQTFFQDVISIKLDSTFDGSAVSANAFTSQTIVDSVSIPTKRAEVLKVYDADAGTGDPKTLLVKQSFGDAFANGQTIITYSTDVNANVATSGVGVGQVFSISEGVYYYDGFFIKNSPQTIAVSKYTTTGNARIGFEITETTISSSSDTSLLDPAQDASNYQAPGSDRYKIELILASRSLESTDDTKFIEIARIENGVLTKDQRYPLYSVLEDTLARRTYDESGNYTVKPFKLALQTNTSNTANMDVILSPGKAYVYGYEFETIGATTLTVPKPRTTSSITDKRITADYGYYVYSNTHYGTFPINSLVTVDLHCVVNSSINVSSTSTISNTKIGTARIKTLQFDYASNTSNSSTYNYKTFLFDVNVGSLTGTVNSAINISTVQIANTLVQNNYRSSVNDAYVGSKFRISSGPGLGESPKLITNYNYVNQTITLDSPFEATLTNASVWAIDFEFNDTKSMVVTSGTTKVAAADIDSRSKDAATTYGDAYISDTSLEPSIVKLGDSYVTGSSIDGVSLSYRRLYESQTFSAGLSPALSVGSGEAISTGSTTSSRQQNYQVVVTSAGTSSYEVGKAIPADLFTVDTGTRKITVTNGNNLTANIYATVDATAPNPKSKTYVAGNTSLQISGGTDIFANGGINLFTANGQIHIAANTIVRTPDTPQSLHVSDVTGLISVLDFNGKYITDANASTATDVTSRYTLNNGQKDSYYDHGYISLKSGYPAPTGPIVVKFNKFTSSGAGYFSVDSYSDYSTIPAYNGSNGERYELRDCLDFRPVRAASTVATANTVSFDVDSSTTGPKIPENGSDILISYDYYLPRTDKVILNKNKTFEVVRGIPSLTPEEPKDKDGGMTLYVLKSPAYVANTSDIVPRYIDHKRYTMRDIGAIEKRVENLEYYTSLTLLEQSTLNKQDLTILDSQNLPRFKNGILVDQFTGHSVADVAQLDYKASIDPVQRELRPSFNVSSQLLEIDTANSSGLTLSGSVVTVSSTEVPFVDQPKASKSVNINPFSVTNFLGKVTVEPKSDVWLDTNRQPDVQLNVGGSKDAWDSMISRTGGNWNYEWGDWQTYWTGVSTSGAVEFTGPRNGNQAVYGTQYTTTTSKQTRSGTASYLTTETITQNIGDRLIDLSIIPYMRTRGVVIVGTDFKPSTSLYPFFDGSLVEKYTARANKFKLAQNKLEYRTTSGDYERVNIHDNTTNTTNGSAYVVRTSNTEVFVISVSPNTSFAMASANLIGEDTGTTQSIVSYDHYSGFSQGASSSVITLSVDASGANNVTDYNAATIFIVSGTGAGQEATIQSYDPATRNVTITGTWTTTPVVNDSVYSIGRMKTTAAGDVAGVFSIPASTFRVGEKQLRLIDNNINDVVNSKTNGDTSFFAQGMVQTVEATILSVTQPVVQRTAVTDEKVVTTTTSKQVITGFTWVDPLAQTFLVDPSTYPEGLFIQRIRTVFKSKDDVMPVTLQLRPTVNGIPSSSVVYPGGSVTLTPDKVNATDSPSLETSTKYTDFVFDNPVYLQPGEHSFVLQANSIKYEVYAAEVGKLDLVANRQISEQPYGGSLFLSQNGSTWTPDQTSDMLFRIYRKEFSRTPATVRFKTVAPSSNVVYDLAHLVVGDLQVANTSVAYAFNSVVDGTGASAGYKSINTAKDYIMNDGSGRRVVTSSNSSFVLQATMTTVNPAISPVIDASRMGVILIENIINDLPLKNADVVVSSTGTGYANASDIIVTISGGGGSGATAVANVVSNTVDAVFITSGGSGYTTSPTIVLTPGSGGGSGAVVSYNGEDKKSGGNSEVRYMTRKVVLNDGFDSGDLRVYLTAYKPALSNINVYYKILSKSDPDSFDNKNYQLMTQLGNENFTSSNEGDYRELMFAPGTTGAANNSVNYTSGSTGYSTFRTFAIKVVISGTSTVDVPKVRDVRAIALPAG